jgi:predicted GNAT family acetyltransferase
VLNVADSNGVARRVYERLGFAEYCVFHEGLARR